MHFTWGDMEVVFLPPDVERRENPVCHFATPLDGNMDLDVHRPTEVKTETFDYYDVRKGNSNFVVLFLVTEFLHSFVSVLS